MKFKRIIAAAAACSVIAQAVPASASSSVDNASASYDGSGMCIAILDNGFMLTHESFTLTDTSPKLTKEASDALLADTYAGSGENAPESVYVSSKIPFAYDYGDADTDLSHRSYSAHGTAMISVAAGNASTLKSMNPDANGIAPEAQILAMKVYSDTRSSVSEEAMAAAVEDALTLGADVILICLTELGGFEYEPTSSRLTAAIERANESGVLVVAAAGDLMRYGSDSVYMHEYEMFELPATSPDRGTVAWPGSMDSVLSVGSSDGNTVESDCFTLAGGRKIPYGDSNYMYEAPSGGKTFVAFFDTKTLEYVVIDGVGTLDDYKKAGDLTGKLAVVTRGTVSFADKAKNAAECGAAGVIVVDNQPDRTSSLTTKLELSDAPIPAVIVSVEYGAILRNASDKRITVSTGDTYKLKTRETPSPSSYSAIGTTPELKLKPDITAVGRSVPCALTNGGYGTINSTTASAAKLAGMCVLVKGRLMSEHPEYTAGELAAKTKALLVGTAELMLQGSGGEVYSPRVQGGGSADLDAALSSELLLTSSGSHKIELGDGHTRLIQFGVTAENLSKTAKECTLDVLIGSDGFSTYTYAELDIENPDDPLYGRLGVDPDDTLSFIEDFTAFPSAHITLNSTLYRLNAAAQDAESHRFTLSSGEKQTFNIVVQLDDETYRTYKEHFPNGFFIEGFVRLASDDETVSIPLTAFSGSFNEAPSLDADLYGGETAIFESRYLYRGMSDTGITDSYRIILGADTFGEPTDSTVYDRTALAFSPVVDKNTSQIMLNFALLRGVSDVYVTVRDSNGSIVEQNYYGNIARTYVSDSTGMQTSVQLPIWLGRARDNTSYIYPDGMYTATVSWKKPDSTVENSFSYDIFLDTSAPTLESAQFVTNEDGTRSLIVKARDNHRIHTVRVLDEYSDQAFGEDNGVFDVTELYGRYIYVDIFDYAANSVTVRLENPIYTEAPD